MGCRSRRFSRLGRVRLGSSRDRLLARDRWGTMSLSDAHNKTTGPSLFRRVTRYPPGPLSTPAENRLTEAFATVLQFADDSLATALLEDWGMSARGSVSVRTQVWSAGGRRVDLQLFFDDSVCWVEVKHGAPLHRDQLSNYQADLQRRQRDPSRRGLV